MKKHNCNKNMRLTGYYTSTYEEDKLALKCKICGNKIWMTGKIIVNQTNLLDWIDYK